MKLGNNFSGLSGSMGGAVYLHIDLNFKSLYGDLIKYSIDTLNITNCYANDSGGALYLSNLISLSIKNSIIRNNKAANRGGGIFFKCYEDLKDKCELNLENTNVILNSAKIGGGIRWNWRKPTLSRSSVSLNTAS